MAVSKEPCFRSHRPGVGRPTAKPRCLGTRRPVANGSKMASHCCEGFCGQPPDSENVSVEQPVVEPKDTTNDDVRVGSEGKLSNLPVFEERSRGPNTSMTTGKHNVFSTHFLQNPNCEVCKLTKITRATCRNSPEARGDRIHHRHKSGNAPTADHKIVDEENESRMQHRHAVVVQDIDSFWIQCHTAKNKTLQETMNIMQKLFRQI